MVTTLWIILIIIQYKCVRQVTILVQHTSAQSQLINLGPLKDCTQSKAREIFEQPDLNDCSGNDTGRLTKSPMEIYQYKPTVTGIFIWVCVKKRITSICSKLEILGGGRT